MKTKGTSAPWHAVKHNWSETSVYGDEQVICTLSIEAYCNEDTQDAYEAKQTADAALICAAPELLSALRAAVRQNEHDMLMTGEELRMCNAAIAKATA